MLNYIFLLELIAVTTGIISVWFAKKENVGLYPIGIVSVVIWIYLCWIGELFGQSVINFFFFVMNLYGWFNWSRKKKDDSLVVTIKRNSLSENIIVVFTSLILTLVLYKILLPFQGEDSTYLYALIEAFITALNFVAMWLMAWKRLEHWVLWIIGDILCIPLFFYKGYYMSVVQFSVFIVIAYLGYKEWRRKIQIL